MADNNGGARPGAGRKKGVPNRMNAYRAARAAATGMLPADVMINNMRYHFDRALAEEGRKPTKAKPRDMGLVLSARDLAQAAARDAAPYYHNRLSSVELSGINGKAEQDEIEGVVYHELTDESIKKLANLVK